MDSGSSALGGKDETILKLKSKLRKYASQCNELEKDRELVKSLMLTLSDDSISASISSTGKSAPLSEMIVQIWRKKEELVKSNEVTRSGSCFLKITPVP